MGTLCEKLGITDFSANSYDVQRAVSTPRLLPENRGSKGDMVTATQGTNSPVFPHLVDLANRRQGQKREHNVTLGDTCHKICLLIFF